jgi:hypothetical protein
MRGFPSRFPVVVFSSVLPMFTPTPMSFAVLHASRSSALAVATEQTNKEGGNQAWAMFVHASTVPEH